VSGAVTSLHFSADGRRLLVESANGTTRLVDVASGIAIGDPIATATRRDDGPTVQQPIRADGDQLAIDTDDGIVTWNLSPRAWTQAACTIAGRNLTRAEWRQHLARLGPYHRTCAV
jgi:WD40 repeat protein